MNLKAISAAGLTLALAACSGTDLESFEKDDFPACFIDQGAWAGEPRVTRYVERSYEELDRHLSRFVGELEQDAREAAGRPQGHWATLHTEAGANIVRLGRLLPRMERAMDLAPMISEMENGQVRWPGGDHPTEYLRVAIAQEVIDHQNSARHMARFLTTLGDAEALLLDLKSGSAGPKAPARLHEIALALSDDWDAASIGFRRVIFDRPDTPADEQLGERLQARVESICRSYSTCSGEGDGCSASDGDAGLLDEPVE